MGRFLASKMNHKNVPSRFQPEGGEKIAYRRREMVGAVRFELTTSCTRNKRASQTTLRPDTGLKILLIPRLICNYFFYYLDAATASSTASARTSIHRASFFGNGERRNDLSGLGPGANREKKNRPLWKHFPMMRGPRSGFGSLTPGVQDLTARPTNPGRG